MPKAGPCPRRSRFGGVVVLAMALQHSKMASLKPSVQSQHKARYRFVEICMLICLTVLYARARTHVESWG